MTRTHSIHTHEPSLGRLILAPYRQRIGVNRDDRLMDFSVRCAIDRVRDLLARYSFVDKDFVYGSCCSVSLQVGAPLLLGIAIG